MALDKDLKEILSTTANIAKTLIERLKDGFQPLPDIMALFPSLMGIQVAIEGNENAWAYLKTLNDEKTEEVVTEVMTLINEASEEAKAVVRYSFLVAANGYMLFMAAKTLADQNTGTTPAPTP